MGPQELISFNLLPYTPATNLEEAQQRDRQFLGKPSSNHKDRQDAYQIKTINHIHYVLACQARMQTQTITWFKKKYKHLYTKVCDLFNVIDTGVCAESFWILPLSWT